MRATGWTTNETIDWAQAAKGPAPLPEGLYKARIASAKPQGTKSENKPMAVLELEFYQDAEGNEIKKRKIKDFVLITQEAAFRVLQICSALEVSPPASNGTEEVEEFCRELVSAAKDGVYVRVKHETSTDKRTGEDRTDMRVARYLNPSQVSGSESTDDAPPPRRSRGNGVSAEAT